MRLMIDPPSGWVWGFPKLIPEDLDTSDTPKLIEWLRSEGWGGKESDLEYCGWFETEVHLESCATNKNQNIISGEPYRCNCSELGDKE